MLEEPNLPDQEKETLLKFREKHHRVFSLKDGDKGERELVQMEINTGDAHPEKQPVRRIPYNLRQEVACQPDPTVPVAMGYSSRSCEVIIERLADVGLKLKLV